MESTRDFLSIVTNHDVSPQLTLINIKGGIGHLTNLVATF
jgi:hypothetical protein